MGRISRGWKFRDDEARAMDAYRRWDLTEYMVRFVFRMSVWCSRRSGRGLFKQLIYMDMVQFTIQGIL